MEVIGPIRHSLADEHVIGVDPKLKPDQPGIWRRRINAFTGRAGQQRSPGDLSLCGVDLGHGLELCMRRARRHRFAVI